MKRNIIISAALLSSMLLTTGCSSPSVSSSGSSQIIQDNPVAVTPVYSQEDIKNMSDEEMYFAARTAVLYHAAYDHETYEPFATAWINVDLMPTVDTVVESINSNDAEMAEKLKVLRSSFEGLKQIADYKDVTFDIWEGHTTIPIPNGEDPNHYSDAQACLADDDGFRPFISDYRLDDPSSAKGTLIAVPSIRSGGHTELSAIADIFNKNGYNVFTVEGRMDTVEGLGYTMLNLDVQRAVRYIRYHADELGIDETKLGVIAGSKGNFSHPMSFNFFDQTPNQYVTSLGTTLDGYEPDEIDNVYSNLAFLCVDYGSAGLTGFGTKFSVETITKSKIYSEENYNKGLKFPDLLIMTGNLDGDTLNDPAILEGLYNYNHLEDKLYPVNYEMHIFNNVAHGFGAGLQYPNLSAQWEEVGIYLDSILNPPAK